MSRLTLSTSLWSRQNYCHPLCVYMCVFVCSYTHTHTCMLQMYVIHAYEFMDVLTWKPGQDVGYPSFITLHIVLVTYWTWSSMTQLDRSPCPHPPVLGLQAQINTPQLFTLVLGSEPRSSCLHHKDLAYCAISPLPWGTFLYPSFPNV